MKRYSTQSLYEAAYLIACGFSFISKDSSAQKTTLIFEDSPALRSSVQKFYNGDATVRAKLFVDRYRDLKDMIFQR